MSDIPQGFYNNPQTGQVQWWDGQQWTAPPPAPQGPPAPQPPPPPEPPAYQPPAPQGTSPYQQPAQPEPQGPSAYEQSAYQQSAYQQPAQPEPQGPSAYEQSAYQQSAYQQPAQPEPQGPSAYQPPAPQGTSPYQQPAQPEPQAPSAYQPPAPPEPQAPSAYQQSAYQQPGQPQPQGPSPYQQPGQPQLQAASPYQQPGQPQPLGPPAYQQPGQPQPLPPPPYQQPGQAQPQPSKPLLKRWWFWVIIALVVIIGAVVVFLLTKGSDEDKPDARASGKATASAAKDTPTPSGQPTARDTPSPDGPSADVPPPDVSARDNSGAVATTLGSGEFAVGVDIPPGRYTITSDEDYGSLLINDAEGYPKFSALLGSDEWGMSVPSVTIDLVEGESIEIELLSSVRFDPAETVVTTTPTAGTWVVGLDIEPGRYEAAPTDPDTSGSFMVNDEEGFVEVAEILGGELGVPTVTVTLEQGQTVVIYGLPSVTLTAVG